MKNHVLLSTRTKEKRDEGSFFRSENSGESRKKGTFFKEWERLSEHSNENRRESSILLLIIEDFMNLSCQNRRFVNDQSESKLYEWAEIEDLWMIKLNRELYEWIEIEDFVNDQAESKLYEWAETEDLWIIKLNRRFYE